MPLPIYLMSNFPSVRPSLNLQFDSQPTPADMTSHLASVGATFSRASIGTYTDANGIIQEATAGQARPNYSSAGVHEGLLIEESRTNLVTNSEDFSGWTDTNVTVTSNDATAPDGTATATKLTDNATNGQHRVVKSFTTSSSGQATYSIFLKRGTLGTVVLNMFSGGTIANADVNLANGTIEKNSGISATIENVDNDWYRCSITGNLATTSTFLYVYMQKSNSISYVGSGDTVFVWGAQLEEGSFATSYIPTIPTFSDRDSIATFLGSDGLIQTASVDVARSDTYVYVDGVLTEAGLLLEGSAENLITSSEDFSTDWNPANSSVIINQAIAPDGKASADKLIANTINTNHSISTTSTTVSGALCFSVFAKADGYNYIRLRFNASSVQGRAWFNLSNGTVGTVDSGVTASIEDYGNGWYRCIAVESGNTNTSVAVQLFPQSADNQTTFAGDGESGVLIWGAQFEEGSQATSYFPTEHSFTSRASTATYFDSNGVLQTASTNVARTDHKYIDGQWVEAGLLLEGASVNLLVRSQDLSTTWSTFNTVVTTNQVNGLDGTLTADFLKENSFNNAHYISQSGTFSSGTTYTFSTFAKNASGARYLQLRPFGIGSGVAFASFDLVNGEIPSGGTGGTDFDSAKIEDVGNGWYRCSITATYTSAPTGFMFAVSNNATSELPSYTGDNTSGFYIWGVQAEAQSQPTSYIKTVSSTATRSADVSSAKSSLDRTRDADSYTTATKVRSADVCYIDGTSFTDFYNEDEGTFFVFWQGLTNGSDQDRWIGVHDSSKASETDDRIIFALGQSANTIRLFVSDDGVIQSSASAVVNTGVNHTIPNKYALAVKLNDVNSYQDGVQVHSSTSVTMPSADKLVFHNGSGSRQYIGYIRKLIYFPRRLSDNELIKLTQ